MEKDVINQKINIYSLKILLRTIVSVYEEKRRKAENAKYLTDVYNELLTLINDADTNKIYDNVFAISLLLPLLYSEEESKMLENKIRNFSYQVVKLKDNGDLIKEYNSVVKKLNQVVSKIINDYEIMNNKCIIYEQELKNSFSKMYLCRGILYKLNTKNLISDYQVSELRKVLMESGWDDKQLIVIQEHIRIHNDKCKYIKPKISYTTINMIERNFVLYDIEELIDIDTKNKLDKCASSIYETLISDDKLDIVNFITEFASWLNDDSLEYVLKVTLNKFLSILNDCKENMLKDNNYDDIDLRKIIIEDFNNCYYTYIKLQLYYNAKFNKSDNIVEEFTNDSFEDSNNLFYAMSGNSSYIERDIEDVPKEYLSRVKKLLEGFKNNTLVDREIDGFTANGKLKGYKKLKDDQVRIVFRNINNNNYLILGIMIKKENRATRDYVSIVKRDYAYNIDNELEYMTKLNESNIIYDNLMDYIENNGRKGNR